MIIHQREIGYEENYAMFFEALVKAKAYLEKKYPEISVELMYNLAGQRGRVTIQTRYALQTQLTLTGYPLRSSSYNM